MIFSRGYIYLFIVNEFRYILFNNFFFFLIIQDAPLSSKVAMFNQAVNKHADAQLLNPFVQTPDGRSSPKPKFSKEEYGK